METFIIIVLSIFIGFTHISCAQGTEPIDVKGVVVENKKAVPEGDVKTDSIRADAEEVQKEIEEIVEEAIEQPTEYDIPEDIVAILQNFQVSFKHTIRTYLATQGVPLNDLGNWKPEGNKVVRTKPPKKKE